MKINKKDAKLLGVCSGIAKHIEINLTILRLIFILCTLYSFGIGIFAYFIFYLLMNKE